MSEISETEIKSMTKEQCYLRGYADGLREYKIVKTYLDTVLNDVKEHEVEFEMFGISDNYVSVSILKDIIASLLSEKVSDTE